MNEQYKFQSSYVKTVSFLKSFDKFGENVNFGYPGDAKQDKFKSLLGAILSIVVYVMTAYVAALTFKFFIWELNEVLHVEATDYDFFDESF